MKKIYLLFLSIIMTGSGFAQNAKHLVKTQKNLTASQTVSLHEKEIAAFNAKGKTYSNAQIDPFVRSRTQTEVIIGKTQYDLQSNSSVQNRFINKADGRMSASWTMSAEPTWGDRGSGYNSFDGTSWVFGSDGPSARLEQVRRTGWPSLNTLANGNDIIIAHFSPPPYDGNVLRQGDDGSWTESPMGTMTGDVGVLWPRSTVGGPDGNTVHAIALTTPTGLSGQVYNGMNGHLLYYRSLDGGETFDKIDVVLPGVDSLNYTSLGGDDYAIHARGNTVAVLVMAAWGDVKVVKSVDNGETWTEHIVYDFPLGPAYDITTGYDSTMIPVDTLTDGGNAVRSTDGAGSVLIDHNGMVHVWYSEIWVSDDDFTDASWSFFPGINSINYWNESFGDGNYTEPLSYLDEDGNGTFDVGNIITDVGSYGQGVASYPSAGIDADGNLYVVYSAVSEAFFNDNSSPGLQHYRHLYVSSSQDNGETWNAPRDIINEEFSDEFFFGFIEGVFPSMAKDVDGFMHIIYQQDFEPGIAVSGDEDDVVDNFIVYTPIPFDYPLVTSTKETVKPEQLNFTVFPNPVEDQLSINFDLENAGNVSFELYNVLGQVEVNLGKEFYTAGAQSKTFNLSNIAKGTYVVVLQTEEKLSTRLIIVE